MSLLQKQLAAIAAKTSNQIDLKAQRAAHSKSLLFEANVAADQDFNTIFQICYDGFAELCALDHRFLPFRSTVFSEQSIYEERLQLTVEKSSELDKIIESFLSLVGARLLLKPAIKATEWLIRRFRIHEYNVNFCILTFLPYHETELYTTLLSILPRKLSPTYKFLHPYLSTLSSPPRQAILHALSYNKDFFSIFNNWVLKSAERGHHHAILLSFWASLATESVGLMIDGSFSGRKAIRSSRVEDLLLLILPVLNHGLSILGVAEVLQGCCMIISVLISKVEMNDRFLDTLLEALLPQLVGPNQECAIFCMSVICQERETIGLPISVYATLSKVGNLEDLFVKLARHGEMSRLAFVYTLTSLDDSTQPNISMMLEANLLDDAQLKYFVQHAFKKLTNSEAQGEAHPQTIRKLLYDLIEHTRIRKICRDVLEVGDFNDEEFRKRVHDDNDNENRENTENGDLMEVDLSRKSHSSIMPPSHVSPQDYANMFMPNESFLALSSADRYHQLFELFSDAMSDAEWFDGTVDVLMSKLYSETTYELSVASFLLRISLSRIPDKLRVTVFEALAGWIMTKLQKEYSDMQTFLPYIFVHLSDKCKQMRLVAAQYFGLLKNVYFSQKDEIHKNEEQILWAEKTIYGENSRHIPWLSNNEALKIISMVVCPNLEEAVLDRKHINRVIRAAINGTNRKLEKATKSSETEMKSSLKTSFASFLCHHAIKTYALQAKCRLYSMLKGRGKVTRYVRSEILLPEIKRWAFLNGKDISRICIADGISLAEAEIAHLEIIDCRESESIGCLYFLLGACRGPDRYELQKLAFQHLISIWPTKKLERRTSIATYLLDLSLNDNSGEYPNSTRDFALETLRSLNLPCETLSSFLDILHSTYQKSSKQIQTKRRKNSGQMAEGTGSTNEEAFSKFLNDLAIILELVEASKLKNRPQLLNGLFQCLGDIQNLRTILPLELSHPQGMLLSCLRLIVENLQVRELSSSRSHTNEAKENDDSHCDFSVVRPDLLADCVRTSSNSEIQNSAIISLANLAHWLPESVLHAIMPIFTFMGNTVLQKSDDYSSYVINQTLTKALPPLILKLKQQNQDVLVGISGIITSFTASFQHIPIQRRMGIFTKLIYALGIGDSLHIVAIALFDKFPGNREVRNFVITLFRLFDPFKTLTAAICYVEAMKNIYHTSGPVAETYLHISERTEDEKISLYGNLIDSLILILSDHKIRCSFATIVRQPDETRSFSAGFAQLLQYAIEFSQMSPRVIKEIVISRLLPCIFSVLPLVDLLKAAGDILIHSDNELRQIVLESVNKMLQSCNENDNLSLRTIFSFLQQLLQLMDNSSNLHLRIAAVTCIDRIATKFGRKDPDTLFAAARTIASSTILNNEEDRLKTTSLLCLTSLVDTLQEKFIPLLTPALPIIFAHLEYCMRDDSSSSEMHDATIELLSVILEHIPFILSESDLNTILRLLQASANSKISKTVEGLRTEMYRQIVLCVDAGLCFAAIENSSRGAIMAGFVPLMEYLEFVQYAVSRYAKEWVMKSSRNIHRTLLTLLDIRSLQEIEGLQQNYSEGSLEAAEQEVNTLAISVILNMNDKLFRPFFVQLVDWTSASTSNNRTVKEYRIVSFFKFYEAFNDQLKAIVTNYATYIISLAQDVLGMVSHGEENTEFLRMTVLRGLGKNFQYDQDGFWQNPAHFNDFAKPLISQLKITTTANVEAVVIPAIVSFAAAANSESHHKELNSDLLKLMRSEEIKHKLAALKCEQSLTTRLGEDWLSLLPEMLPLISEMSEDDDEAVERETQRWIKQIEEILGEKLDSMLR